MSNAALAERLETLGISAPELAVIVRRTVEDVEALIEGAEPDAETRILLRLVMDPERAHAAKLAAERVRSMRTLPLRQGEDWQTAGIEPPYGSGHQGATGGGWQ